MIKNDQKDLKSQDDNKENVNTKNKEIKLKIIPLTNDEVNNPKSKEKIIKEEIEQKIENQK